MGVSYISSTSDGSFTTVSITSNYTQETLFSMEDADGTGTILKIGTPDPTLYILPLYSPT
jgi:hypothetical protein